MFPLIGVKRSPISPSRKPLMTLSLVTLNYHCAVSFLRLISIGRPDSSAREEITETSIIALVIPIIIPLMEK